MSFNKLESLSRDELIAFIKPLIELSAKINECWIGDNQGQHPTDKSFDAEGSVAEVWGTLLELHDEFSDGNWNLGADSKDSQGGDGVPSDLRNPDNWVNFGLMHYLSEDDATWMDVSERAHRVVGCDEDSDVGLLIENVSAAAFDAAIARVSGFLCLDADKLGEAMTFPDTWGLNDGCGWLAIEEKLRK